MNLPTTLKVWANAHKPDKGMEGSFWKQIVFVRDDLPKTLIGMYNYNLYEAISNRISVISTHTSKSILLPVYEIVYPGSNLKFIARNNFYDWKVSVISDRPVKADFGNLFNPKQKVPSVYCEGFNPLWVFGPHGENDKKFTVELQGNYDTYTFFWLVRHALNLP